MRIAILLRGLIRCLVRSDEIPQGLQLLANAAGHTLLLNGQKDVQKSVIISSIFRLVVGYLFLSSLFINIAQNADVIEIFYDGELSEGAPLHYLRYATNFPFNQC